MITRIRLESGFCETVEDLQADLDMAEAAMLREELKLTGYAEVLTEEEMQDDRKLLASGLVSGTVGDQLGRDVTDEVFQRQGSFWIGRRVVAYTGAGGGEDEERLDFHVEDFTSEPGNSHMLLKAGNVILANVPVGKDGDFDDGVVEDALAEKGYSMKEVHAAQEALGVALLRFIG